MVKPILELKNTENFDLIALQEQRLNIRSRLNSQSNSSFLLHKKTTSLENQRNYLKNSTRSFSKSHTKIRISNQQINQIKTKRQLDHDFNTNVQKLQEKNQNWSTCSCTDQKYQTHLGLQPQSLFVSKNQKTIQDETEYNTQDIQQSDIDQFQMVTYNFETGQKISIFQY